MMDLKAFRKGLWQWRLGDSLGIHVVGPLRFYAHGDNRTFTRARPFSDDRWGPNSVDNGTEGSKQTRSIRIVGHVWIFDVGS